MRGAFLHKIHQLFPALNLSVTDSLTSENLISDHVLELPAGVRDQAAALIEACFSLRLKPAYREFLSAEMTDRDFKEPGNFGFAMSYDFHLDSQGTLKLIEINTNASFLALGTILHQAAGTPRPDHDFKNLRESLEEELRLTGRKTENPRTLIIDEDPEQQRLYLEFLVYRELFQSWGWPTEIVDTRRATTIPVDLIYNRDTDFFLQKSELQSLKVAWEANNFCLTPHPAEYLALADKQRQVDWATPGFLEKMGLTPDQIATLRRHLPEAQELAAHNADEIWARRKHLFFKPKRSFGAKHSFRGASISNKAFQEMIGGEILAQEFVPAAEVKVATPDGPQIMKYDLRFYAYQGKLQTVVARLYQGQVTNLRTPHGGFAAVRFV